MNPAYESLKSVLGASQADAAIQEYLRNGGQNLDPQVTAWCAAAVNAALNQTGQEGTNSLAARSFLNWGQEVSEPQRGDIAVFSRGDPNGWQGHVGFFDGFGDDGSIRVLGGNQSNGVNVSSYSRDRLLGFRRGENALASNDFPTAQQPGQNALAAPQAPTTEQRAPNALQQFAMMQQLMPQQQQMNPQDFMNRRRF